MNFYPTFGKTPDKESRRRYAEITRQFAGKTFRNVEVAGLTIGKTNPTSPRVRPKELLPVETPDLSPAEEGKMKFTWFGHSSILFQFGAKYVFLDPVLSNRISPVGFAGPKRFTQPPINVDDVPELDLVFISHDHYDHLDNKTIRALDSRIKHYVVPLGIESCLKGWGVDPKKISALNWWENVELEGLTCTLAPSQHFSGRNPLKMNRTFWGGLIVSDGSHTAYYSGDSGYWKGFEEIGRRFDRIDIALIDTGQYDPGWKTVHMNARQSTQAAVDARAKRFVPIHWGAFVLSHHAWDEPPRQTLEEAAKKNLNVAIPRLGQTVELDRFDEINDPWWERFE